MAYLIYSLGSHQPVGIVHDDIGASVVRAAVMGSLTLGASLFGRPSEARWLLWLTIWIVGMWQPLMLVSVGFQLSVAATAGILYLTPYLTLIVEIATGSPLAGRAGGSSSRSFGMSSALPRRRRPS